MVLKGAREERSLFGHICQYYFLIMILVSHSQCGRRLIEFAYFAVEIINKNTMNFIIAE